MKKRLLVASVAAIISAAFALQLTLPARASQRDTAAPNRPGATANYDKQANKIQFRWSWRGDKGANPVGYCTARGVSNRGFACNNILNPPFWWHIVDNNTGKVLYKSYNNQSANKSFKWNSSNGTAFAVSCQGRAGHTIRIDVRARDANGNINPIADHVTAKAKCPAAALPDLTVTNAWACKISEVIGVGIITDTVRLSFTVKNDSGVDVTKAFTANFINHSQNQTFIIAGYNFSGLAAGKESGLLQKTIEIYSYGPPISITANVDINNRIQESDETNNYKPISVYSLNWCPGSKPEPTPVPVAKPDLTTSNLQACIEGKTDNATKLRVSYRVNNNSSANVNNEFLAGIYTQMATSPDGGPTSTYIFNKLAAHNSETARAVITYPASFISAFLSHVCIGQPASCYANDKSWANLSVKTDYDNRIPESNDSNNWAQFKGDQSLDWCPGSKPEPTPAPNLPDLKVSNGFVCIAKYDAATRKATTRYGFTVTNNSNVNITKHFTVRATLKSPEVSHFVGGVSKDWQINGLAANKSVYKYWSVLVSSPAPPRNPRFDYIVTGVADLGNVIKESNEGNDFGFFVFNKINWCPGKGPNTAAKLPAAKKQALPVKNLVKKYAIFDPIAKLARVIKVRSTAPAINLAKQKVNLIKKQAPAAANQAKQKANSVEKQTAAAAKKQTIVPLKSQLAASPFLEPIRKIVEFITAAITSNKVTFSDVENFHK